MERTRQADAECVVPAGISEQEFMGREITRLPPSQGEAPSLDTLRRLIQEEVGKQLESESCLSRAQMRPGL